MRATLSQVCKHLAIIGVIGSAILPAAGVRAAELTFALKIEHGQVPANMRLIRVMQGDTVKLELSSDQRALVHLHGYEIQKEVMPGTVTELAFTASLSGRFPVHLHAGQAETADHAHEDTLANIEVYPR
jgi:translation initiation factor IF-1